MMSDEVFQAINKYVMGNQQKINVLKERFESMDDWSPVAAAAIGYLIAKDELEAAKEEEEEPDVYDEVVEVIKKYCRPPGPNSTHMAADEIFTLICEWLDGELAKPGFPRYMGDKIHELFLPFVINEAER